MKIIAGTLALLLWAHGLEAQTEKKAAFVTAEQLAVASVLPFPPTADSTMMKEELRQLHKLQETRTAAQVEQAKQDDVDESIFLFKGVLGDRFDRKALPLTALLSDHVHNDEGIIVNPAKTFFARPRPYQFDATIKPVCKATSVVPDAFPSGHATTGYLEAFVLAMIVPERRNEILARADEYAQNRLICGVHYASDLVASKGVAYAMIGLMMQHPQFKQELEAARTETRRALGLTSR